MPQIYEVPVSINTRTAQEGLVSVPEACYERCKELSSLIGKAAIHQLDCIYDAVICDSENRRYTFPRNCPAVRAHFSFEGASGVSPFIVGEGETQGWVARVDKSIYLNGVLGLVDASKQVINK